MKILIRLESKFYTDDENEYCYDNMIELNWDLPFLPRQNDGFDCDSIIDNKMPEFDKALAWNVFYIDYKKINGEIIPILWLMGE